MITTFNEYYISFALFPQALEQSIIEIGQLSLSLVTTISNLCTNVAFHWWQNDLWQSFSDNLSTE